MGDQGRDLNQTLPAPLLQHHPGYESHNVSKAPHGKWDPRQFEPLTTLKGGSHTAISLVQLSQTQQLYAMKTYRKKDLQDADIQSINTEKALLLLAKRGKCPFVVEVFGGFQTSSHVMLYLEFCQGGDLMHNLRTDGPFDLERTRYIYFLVRNR